MRIWLAASVGRNLSSSLPKQIAYEWVQVLRVEGPMTHTRVSEVLTKLAARVIRSSRLVPLALVAAFTSVAMQPAQAQSSDTWKSVAIIGGSTAAGAYIGHKMAGRTGAVSAPELGPRSDIPSIAAVARMSTTSMATTATTGTIRTTETA